MSIEDEIVVTGARRRPVADAFGGFGRGFLAGGGAGSRTFVDPRVEPIDEIVVTAAAPVARSAQMGIRSSINPLPFADPVLSRETTRQLDRLLLEATNRTTEEITVIGRRAPVLRTAARFASRLNLPLTAAEVGGQLISAIVRQLSRQALDEAGRIATSRTRFRPDTPVRTMPVQETNQLPAEVRAAERFAAQQMDEIVVTGRRPRSAQFADPVLTRQQIAMFNQDLLRSSLMMPTAQGQTASQTSTRTRTSPGTGTRNVFNLRDVTDRLLMQVAGTAAVVGTGVRTLTGTSVPTQTAPLTSPQPVQFDPTGAAVCAPAEESPRKKCYKKMVKERRLPKDDIENRWVEINCETGKEIPPKR